MAGCRPIVNCIFDLVNTKNPSGHMIGPGNCQWFHNLMLFVTDGVSESIQKVLRNHAAIHNACGFMLTHTDWVMVLACSQMQCYTCLVLVLLGAV